MTAATPLAYLNGNWLPAEKAGLPLNDAGFVYGATVTDMVRTFRHRPYRLDAHLARFRQSCALCQVPLELGDEELSAIAEELVARNAPSLAPEHDLALVMFATPGPLGMYSGDAADGPPTLGMHTFPLPLDRHRRLYQEGARLVIASTPANASVDQRAKQRSRMHWWLARLEANRTDPLADALLLDADGFVTETASANLIAVIDGTLVTPPAGTALPGISLDTVKNLAAKLGIGFRGQHLSPEDCYTAEELILTCTTWCLAGVSQLDGRAKKWSGPVHQRLREAWCDEVGMTFS